MVGCYVRHVRPVMLIMSVMSVLSGVCMFGWSRNLFVKTHAVSISNSLDTREKTKGTNAAE